MGEIHWSTVFSKKITVTSTSKQIIDLVTEQLKNKEEYFKKVSLKV